MSEQPTNVSTGTRLDPWIDAYAERTRGLTASQVRALFAVASRPEVVSLAGGMPFVSALPLDAIADTVARLIRDRGAVALQYGSGQGDVTLREQILEVMEPVGVRAHPDDIVVTAGSQMALDLVVRVFCDPGDVVLVEAPTYVTALGVFSAYQCRGRARADGRAGHAARRAARGDRRRARAGPDAQAHLHDPVVPQPGRRHAGPGAPRRGAARSRARTGILLLEDDPYGLLGFDGTVPRAIRADEAEGVIYLGTFSKTIAAGLRVGWAVAPHGVREKLVLANETATLCPLEPHAAHHLRLPRHAAVVRPGEGVPRGLPRASRRAARVARGAHARRHALDRARRRLLLVGHAARRAGRHRDAAARGHRAGGLRARHRLLRRRPGPPVAAPVVLLPRARPHPRGRAPPRRRDRGPSSSSPRRSAPRRRSSTATARRRRAPDLA